VLNGGRWVGLFRDLGSVRKGRGCLVGVLACCCGVGGPVAVLLCCRKGIGILGCGVAAAVAGGVGVVSVAVFCGSQWLWGNPVQCSAAVPFAFAEGQAKVEAVQWL